MKMLIIGFKSNDKFANKSRRKPCMFFNEIVRSCSATDCTMKSLQARMKSSAFASDEIKSDSHIPTKSDFIAKRFHPTQVGFLPPSADLVEKSTHCLGRQMCAFFWCSRWDLNSQGLLHWLLRPTRMPIPPRLHNSR